MVVAVFGECGVTLGVLSTIGILFCGDMLEHKSMKILFFRHSFLSRGGDKMIAIHASYLAEQGHEVTIAANVHDTVFPVSDRVKIERISGGGKLGTICRAVLVSYQYDVVIADIITMIFLLMVRNRTKLVYFAQDYDESYYESGFAKMLIRSIYMICLRILAIPVLAVSSELAEILRARFKAQVALAENGVDEQQFFPDPAQSLVALKAGKKAILLLSRSDKRKGFDLGIEVIQRVAASNPDFVVWSVGEKATGVFGEIPHQDFGYVRGDELRRIMSSADILLYPSRHEGFPLMILEAFDCKLPVVTTKAVSLACHRENALVAGLEDIDTLSRMLLELLDDDILADQLAAAAVVFAADHSMNKATAVFESHLLRRVECCWAGHS